MSSKKAIVEKWLTQSVEEIEDSESSRESQTSIFDDLKTLRDENIKVNFCKNHFPKFTEEHKGRTFVTC